jgi:hypothetical protein
MKSSQNLWSTQRAISILLFVTLFLVPKWELFAQAYPTPSPATDQKRKIQIALILDTSGSMEGLLEQAKSQLWLVVSELTKATYQSISPSLEIALFEYGNDGISAQQAYIRQISPLSTDLDAISSSLFALSTNGGQEYCGAAIQKATQSLEWSPNDKDIKLIFIAGNEPFTQGTVNYEAACGNARSKDILINTIHCGSFSEGIAGKWKSGAMIGGGEYMSIDHNQRTVYIPSPYDDRINELSINLNKTYLYYGTQGKSKKVAQESADADAETYSKSNLTSRNVIKATKYYKNSSWDLVDALDDKTLDIKTIDRKTLPVELQSLTDEQLKKYIEKKKEERETLKLQIEVLNNERQKYLASKQTQKESNLESGMVNAIKKQANSKQYEW